MHVYAWCVSVFVAPAVVAAEAYAAPSAPQGRRAGHAALAVQRSRWPVVWGARGATGLRLTELTDLTLQGFLLGSFLGAFKADALIARGQARCVLMLHMRALSRAYNTFARSTLSGGAQQRWNEEKAKRGDGRVIVLHGDAADAAEDDEAER